MNTSAAVLLMCFPVCAPLFGADAPEAWDARLTQAKGEVTVYTADNPGGVPGEKDMPLETGDRVATGKDSSAEVGLDGESAIELSPDSDFTLESARKSSALWKLDVGTILLKIRALLPGQNMSVRTPTASAAVRGTEFGVEVQPGSGGETHVGVFDEGKVEVRGEAGGAETLIANQETAVSKGGNPLPAYQLRRFVRHRQFMRSMRARVRNLRRRWKKVAGGERRKARRQAFERMRQKRERLRQEQEKRLKGKKAKKARPEERADQKKMEKFREEIRRRRRGK